MEAATTLLPRRANDRERDTERACLPMLFKTTLPLRFWSKVYVDDYGCWLWTVTCSSWGYGAWMAGRRSLKRTWPVATSSAYRLAYIDFVGLVPEGYQLDHLCRVRCCVNPSHLEVVTQRENILRGEGTGARHARQTHCKRGHEFTLENTRVRPSRPRRRECRVCLRAMKASYGRSESGRAAKRSQYQRRKAKGGAVSDG